MVICYYPKVYIISKLGLFMEKVIALVFALFVLLNEFMLTINVNIAAFMYLVLMSVSLFLLAKQETLNDSAKMIVVLLCVPLVRIAGLFMDISYVWKVSLGSGILLFLGIYYMYKFNIDIGLNLKSSWMFTVVISIGAVVGAFGNILFDVNGGLVFVAILPMVVFSEEIFFRGLMQNLIEKSCGVYFSIIIPAVIYGALSLYLGMGLAVLFFISSIFSGLVYFSTRNIFLSIVFSLTLSIFVFAIPGLI